MTAFLIICCFAGLFPRPSLAVRLSFHVLISWPVSCAAPGCRCSVPFAYFLACFLGCAWMPAFLFTCFCSVRVLCWGWLPAFLVMCFFAGLLLGLRLAAGFPLHVLLSWPVSWVAPCCRFSSPFVCSLFAFGRRLVDRFLLYECLSWPGSYAASGCRFCV